MAKVQIIERIETLESTQKDHGTQIGLLDLVLNGKPQQEIHGLIKQHKKTREMVEEHNEYLKKKKWIDKLLMTLGGIVGGAIVTLVIKYIETKI